MGVNKPDKAIFTHALLLGNAQKHESVMIGDSIEADIRGAMNFGMDAIYFNPGRLTKPADVMVEVHSLNDLTLLL